MAGPELDDPPLADGVCASWAQPHELPEDVQGLHDDGTWCVILSLASDILWAASGRQWRNVAASETVTLDHPDMCPRASLPWWAPGWAQAGWRPLYLPGGNPNKVRLPRPDVTAITAVTIDGAAFTSYRLAGSWAIRTDGHGWPTGPDRTRITYSFGRLVPPGGRLSAVSLTTELGKAWAGKACALPARVTSVTRQGITYEALESLEFLRAGLTGLYGVDAWIKAVNPDGLRQSGRVWSPDVTEARRV